MVNKEISADEIKAFLDERFGDNAYVLLANNNGTAVSLGNNMGEVEERLFLLGHYLFCMWRDGVKYPDLVKMCAGALESFIKVYMQHDKDRDAHYLPDIDLDKMLSDLNYNPKENSYIYCGIGDSVEGEEGKTPFIIKMHGTVNDYFTMLGRCLAYIKHRHEISDDLFNKILEEVYEKASRDVIINLGDE